MIVSAKFNCTAFLALTVCGSFCARSADKPPAALHTSVPVPAGYSQLVLSHPAMYAEFVFTILFKEQSASRGEISAAAQEAFDAIDRLEGRISTWRPGSQASRINFEGAQHPVGVAMDILDLVQTAVTYSRETGGAFDITVGPLVELWQTCKKEKRVPTETELSAARSVVGSDKLIIVPEDHSVGFKVKGMRLDFGGIAKGLAVDEAAEILKARGITCALLDGGTSSLLAIGAPPGQPGWIIQLRRPYNDSLLDETTIKDEAVSTSGYLETAFEVNGKKYGHIIDPRTGMPAQGTMYAMVVGPSGTMTEALSKGFFINGADWAKQYCAKHPRVRGIVVPDTPDGKDPAPIRINFTN